MNLRSLIGCSVITFVAVSDGAAQVDHRLTIPELIARQAPEPLVQFRVRELLPEPLEEIVPKANLVARGKVESSKAYLSDDQRDLYTDWVFTPSRVILKRAGPVSRMPSPGGPITVQCWGGQTIIQGVQVRIEDKDFRAFRPGEELLLILKYDSSDGKYRLVSPVSGAFELTGGHVGFDCSPPAIREI